MSLRIIKGGCAFPVVFTIAYLARTRTNEWLCLRLLRTAVDAVDSSSGFGYRRREGTQDLRKCAYVAVVSRAAAPLELSCAAAEKFNGSHPEPMAFFDFDGGRFGDGSFAAAEKTRLRRH